MATLARPILKEYDRSILHSNCYRLEEGAVKALSAVNQSVFVVSGCAWITVNGQDMVVSAGQRAALFPEAYPPVISAVGGGALVYEIVT
jgi:hypothetical protein